MKITTERSLPHDPEAVWARLADVGNIADWLPGIGQSSATGFEVGATRTCTLDPPKQGIRRLDETFTVVGERELAYDIEGMPFGMHNHWYVLPAAEGDGTLVRVETTLSPRGILWLAAPLLKGVMRKQMRGMLGALDRSLDAT